jgi:tetratricopeptide (TPR) repeat protein
MMQARLCRAACALAFALGACSSNPNEPDPEQELALHREFANTFFDNGDLVQAEVQADLGLQIDPDDRALRLMKGWILQRRGTPESVHRAEAIFRELEPGDDYRAALGLASALERKGVLYWESAVLVERGERPTNAPDRVARASEMRADARRFWGESARTYRAALDLKPGEAQAINGLQRVHALLGELQESLEWSEELLAQSEAETAFWRKRLEQAGLAAREEERLRALLAASERLVVETHLHASGALVSLGRRDEALVHVEHALAVDPDHAEGYSRRAQILLALGRVEEARAAIQEFLRRSTEPFEDPDIQRALALLADCDAKLAGGAASRE